MRGTISLLLAVFAAGCSPRNENLEPKKVPLNQAPAAAQGAAADAVPAGALGGPVLQKLDAPPYSYLQVKTSQGEVWAAVPQTTLATGAIVRVYNPMLMQKFESKQLKRTFTEVYFGTLTPDGSDANANGAGQAPPMGAAGAQGADPHAGVPMQPSAPVKVGKVEKATGADAYSIADAWAQREALNGKTVTIRGVVVKYNPQVMKKNWIHLQDGSGDATKGDNDITVTTLDETAKGATITIRGTAKTSKDFGAGYRYAIIVEDAKILKP